MKSKLFAALLVFFFSGTYLLLNGKTEEETIDFINAKLDAYSLKDPDVQRSESLSKMKNSQLFMFNSTIYGPGCNPCTLYAVFDPKNVISINLKYFDTNIHLILNFNSPIDLYDKDWKLKYNGSHYEFILAKNIPEDQLSKIKKAFKHLIEMKGGKLVDDLF